MQRRFIQCDVFSDVATRGNGLAVVLDGQGLSDEAMQAFAAWTNLAESTFLFPPTDDAADYKVRIFTPAREMLFAGHPTLGSCAAWLSAGGSPADPNIVRQECGVGIVEIHQNGKQPAFVAPPTRIADLPPELLQAITGRLEIDPATILGTALLDNGPVFPVLELSSADAVLALDASKVRWPEFRSVGFIGAHPPDSEIDYEVRMLAPSSGMSEDPITGSLNAGIGHWMQAQRRLTSDLTMAQGTSIGRCGRVSISEVNGRVLIGGNTRILIDGVLEL